ncbi:sugar phosphate isomerase/epimerase family protein [Klebsiella pneumoniae]|uniref:sugar phosphate isomerase/epimerase family protein n=1 Tax=Klebsiella pneumoniae TaxID=573 RepID=UPI00232E0222|nr:sugar phosphate isomerase/epimerase [Klebsiella pneumoniae]MDB7856292.1 sugar phosphate isomerase/epimerase [Klebsiella pneumoniae]
MKLGYGTNAWGGVVGHPGGVTSIKDAYYLANGSSEQAIRDIAAVGYNGFEMFDGNLMQFRDDKQAFRDLLQQTSQTFIGVYSGANFIYPDILEEELLKFRNVAELTAELGGEHFVIGGGAIRGTGIRPDDHKLLADGLNQAMQIAEQAGLVASYHPHLGSLVESPEQLDQIMTLTDIHLCPDTAHIEAGGGDPADVVRRYGKRIKYIHFKDLKNNEFLPLGSGVQNFDAIVSALKEHDYDGWITVELDSYADPRAGAQISKDFLKKHFDFV